VRIPFLVSKTFKTAKNYGEKLQKLCYSKEKAEHFAKVKNYLAGKD